MGMVQLTFGRNFLLLLANHFYAACCLNIWFCAFVCMLCYVCPKKNSNTSKQGRRLRFGMLTVLTNMRSTKVLYNASCFKHYASCILHFR